MSTSARIQLRRDTAANWTSANPVLAAGEPGFETDTGNQKIGDGVTAWTTLTYEAGASETVVTVASSGASQTIPDPSAGAATVSDITLTAACTFTLPPNPASGKASSFSVWLRQDGTGGRVPTFTGAKWANKAGAPTFSVAASAIDLVIGESIPNAGGWLLTTVLNVG